MFSRETKPLQKPDASTQQLSDETLSQQNDTSGFSPVSWSHDSDPNRWIGRQIERYELVGLLGTGGMGVVFEAIDTTIGRRVALKILPPQFVAEEIARRRFIDEAKSAGKLSHPHTVILHEIGQFHKIQYIVMEFVAGGSTHDALQRGEVYSPLEATRMAREAAAGLAAAHAADIIHRDVKPANLLLTTEQTVKVTDFGLAKRDSKTGLGVTRDGQLLGTPSFMSPEQCELQEVDAQSDIYSLGATYYSLLAGEPPYQDQGSLMGVMYAHCHATPPDPSKIRDTIPAACCEVVERAMAKQPQDRYETMQQMEEALWDVQQVLGGDTTVPANARAPAKVQPSPSSKAFRLTYAALACLLVAGVAALFVNLRNHGPSEIPGGLVPAGDPIKVGILHSLSGTMADSERPVIDAVLLAIEQINSQGGVLGHPVVPIVADGKSNPETFANEARRLIEQEGVCTVFGCWTSESRKTVVPIFEDADNLLIYPVQYEGIEESPNVIYIGAAPNQQILPALDWFLTQQNKRRFFLVGSDYVFPRMANEIIKDHVLKLGGNVVGEAYLPLGSYDVNSIVAQIQQTQPDIILNTINGSSNVPFFSALRAVGITPGQIPTLSFSIGEAELRRLDIAAMVGDYAAWNYFQSIDSPENEEFVKLFQSKYGPHHVLTDPMETAFSGVLLWAKAVTEAGSTNPQAIRRAIRGMRGSGPSGPLRIDAATQHAFKTPRIGKVRQDGQFEIVWTAPAAISPQPYPSSRSAAEWRATLHDLYRNWGNRWSPAPTKR